MKSLWQRIISALSTIAACILLCLFAGICSPPTYYDDGPDSTEIAWAATENAIDMGLSSRRSGPLATSNLRPTSPPIAGATCRSWQQAQSYLGTHQCICGYVTHTKTSGKNYFIHFDIDNQSFYGVSWAYYWPDNTFEGYCVQLCGDVVENYGRPRIVIDNPEQQVFQCPAGWTDSSAPPKAVPTKKPTPKPTAKPAPPCSCAGNLYNCADFQTHSQAQRCFNYCMAEGYDDIHQLDMDDDGIACELLP